MVPCMIVLYKFLAGDSDYNVSWPYVKNETVVTVTQEDTVCLSCSSLEQTFFSI